MRKLGLAAAAAVIATPLMCASAWASACVTGTVAQYEALTSCTVDNGLITFSDFNVNTIGNVTLGNFTPFVELDQYGIWAVLELQRKLDVHIAS